MPDNVIHVALATDCNYLDFAMITAYSVIHSHKGEMKLCMHVFTSGVEACDFARIESLSCQGVEITRHPVDTAQFAQRWDGMTSPMYFRLELAERLPNVERCIYLDCDVIVLDDIELLWKTKLNGRPLGGVADRAGLQKKRCVYNTKQPMFNSGVLLLDLAQWRRENYVESLAEFWKKERSWMNFADQGLLNAYFDGNYTILPQRWNIINSVYRNPPMDGVYDSDEIAECIRKPGIVHFTGHHKPWLFWKRFHHPYGYTFCLCALKCPVSGWYKAKMWLKLKLFSRIVESKKQRPWGKKDIRNFTFD